ncbi:MAG: hypothetical protein JXR86_13930 [Spirochaetales bacterium]|nr:hypothetical protein [Spirochaetales bacterium]
MKKIILLISIVILVFTGCNKPIPTSTPEAKPAAAAVSDGSEDLVIDLQVGLNGNDSMNHFIWKGNIRYMAAEDSYDAASGASAAGSTHLFMTYLYDVEAKNTMSTGLRGLFLFGVTGASQVVNDNLHAMKNSDGSISILYVHRGTAYRFTTDSKGILSLPDAKMESRKIGTPQELEAEFSSDGTAMGVDFEKVFSSNVVAENYHPEAMYFWDGDLKVTLENGVLAMTGVLTAVRQ